MMYTPHYLRFPSRYDILTFASWIRHPQNIKLPSPTWCATGIRPQRRRLMVPEGLESHQFIDAQWYFIFRLLPDYFLRLSVCMLLHKWLHIIYLDSIHLPRCADVEHHSIKVSFVTDDCIAYPAAMAGEKGDKDHHPKTVLDSNMAMGQY